MTTPINVPSILQIDSTLYRRRIRKSNGNYFSAKDMSDIIRFFEREKAANAVNYRALIQLDGKVYSGWIVICRDGKLHVTRSHPHSWD